MARFAAAILGLAFAVAGSTGPAAAQHRELGAHEHGRGTLNIAVEGTQVTMELEVPGRRHRRLRARGQDAPSEKAAVEKAKTQLLAPLALFELPAAAGCVVTEAKVEVESGEHDHDAKAQAKAAKEQAGKAAGQRATGIPSSTPSTRSSARAPAT